MASRHALAVLFLSAAGVSAAVACSSYVPPDVANYGPPNGLKTPPNGVAAAPPGGDSGASTPPPATGDGGTTPTGEGGAPTATFACVTAGGTLLPAGTPCAVSWKTQIYPNMVAGGAWNCAGSSCHGTGSTTPPSMAGDEHAVYVSLANYTGTTATGAYAGLPYLSPCSTDPNKSTFVCNTKTAGACGIGAMPLGSAIADAGDIATWVACGAPEN